MPFATTWMDFEGIMLSEKVREREIPYDLTYRWNLKKNKFIDTDNSMVVARGEGLEGGCKMNEEKSKLQPSNYEINKSWRCNV